MTMKMKNTKTMMTRLCCAIFLMVGCVSPASSTGSPEAPEADLSYVDGNGRLWHDLGVATTTTEFAELSDSIADEVVLLDEPAGQLAGTYRLDENGHEFYAEPIEDDVLARMLEAYEAQAASDAAIDDVVEIDDEIDDEGTVTLPQIVGFNDSRVRVVGRTANPFSGIGLLSASVTSTTSSVCTGTLVSPQHVAISAHCVYNRSQNAWIVTGSNATMCFALGCYPVISRRINSFWRDSSGARARVDYALIKVGPNAFGLPTGAQMSLSNLNSSSSLQALNVRHHGYPATGNMPRYTTEWWNNTPGGITQLWGNSGYRITGTTSLTLFHNADTKGGHSGGPIYYQSGSSFFLLGIHSGGSGTRNSSARVAGSGTPTRLWLVSNMVTL